VVLHFELAQKRQFLRHDAFQHVRELLQALHDVERQPNVVILVALNGKAIVKK
jgi:hypothetical protein